MKRISMFTAVLLAGALVMSAPAQDDPFAGQEPASDFPSLPDIPDLASEFQQGENEGSASFSESTGSETRSVRKTERSEGGISLGDFGHGASDQDWNEPQQTTRHHSGGTVTTIDAGPIWGNDDAQGKCRSVCSDNNMGWGGVWRTVGATSYCDCTQAGGAAFPGGDRTTSCFAPRNHQCPGCSISCSGGQQAVCTQGNRGIFNGPNDTLCATNAVCECR